MNAIGDKVAIAGIGQTPFSRSLGRSEFDMAIEAIFAAYDAAGISPARSTGSCATTWRRRTRRTSSPSS